MEASVEAVRQKCDNVIWILGGDSPVQKPEHAATIRAMALGLREGGSGQRLMTFHPSGMGSSSLFHGDAWLDFKLNSAVKLQNGSMYTVRLESVDGGPLGLQIVRNFVEL